MAEITVNNYIDFRNALQGPDYDVVHLSGDIDFVSPGPEIPRTKPHVVIDGHGFTITDVRALVGGDTVHFDSVSMPGDFSLTIQNVVWNGRNFYGLSYAPGVENFRNFTLNIINVDYTGPQPVYNRRGTTRFVDSKFYIDRNGSTSVPEELGEVNRVIIEGDVSVVSNTTGVSVLWFLSTGTSLTVEENANFTVVAASTYMWFVDGDPPPMVFKKGSTTNIHTRWGLFYAVSDSNHLMESFTLEEGASFTSTQNDRRTTPPFKCVGAFNVHPGSSLFISAEVAGTTPLLYFVNRTTLNFDDPKSVVLYNNGGRVFGFNTGTTANPNTVNINTELLNMWTTPGDGGFDDIPLRALAKADGSNISAEIKLSTSTTATTSVTSNIVDGDAGYPMSTVTFNVATARVLSMGRLPVKVDKVKDISEFMTGSTESLANLRAIYSPTTLNGAADEGGNIRLPIPSPITPGTTVRFGSNWKYLTKYIEFKTFGSVSITHVSDLYFVSVFVPCRTTPIRRKDADWYVEVTDTRLEGGKWWLNAWILDPMTSPTLATLDNALILREPDMSEDILNPTPLLVREETWTAPNVVTHISWAELRGFLLRLNPDFAYQAGKYTTYLHWEVIDEEDED